MSYYRWRSRRYGRRTDPRAAAAVGVALALAAAGHAATGHHHHQAPPAAARDAASAAGGHYTPQSWAPAFLAAARLPRTACNRAAVVAWERAEGGNWANTAAYNPLDTTMPEPGSHPMNAVNVQAYQSWREGLAASAATIRNGRYPGIIAAFHHGGNASAVAAAVAVSPWGTAPFTASC